MYGIQSASEYIPDLIFQNGNDIYKCFYDPSKAIKNGVPYEDQEIWQIVLVHQETQEDGLEIIKTLYPNGSIAHDFSPNKINEYNFRYRL